MNLPGTLWATGDTPIPLNRSENPAVVTGHRLSSFLLLADVRFFIHPTRCTLLCAMSICLAQHLPPSVLPCGTTRLHGFRGMFCHVNSFFATTYPLVPVFVQSFASWHIDLMQQLVKLGILSKKSTSATLRIFPLVHHAMSENETS